MSGLTLINFNREFEDAPQNNHRGKPSHFGFCSLSIDYGNRGSLLVRDMESRFLVMRRADPSRNRTKLCRKVGSLRYRGQMGQKRPFV